MAVLTRFGVINVSGSDLTYADADVASGLFIVHLSDGQVAVFGLAPA